MRFLQKGLAGLAVMAALPLVAATAVGFALRDRLADWWFRCGSSRKMFIVCSRRDGWHDFLVNNLVPVLPPSISVIWFEPGSRNVLVRSLPASLRRALRDHDRPALVGVTNGAFRAISLHRDLLKWKPSARRSESVRSQVRLILAAAQARLVIPGPASVDPFAT